MTALSGAPPRILIVDDDASIRRLIEITLRKAGYRYSMANNGLRAIEIMETETPDLVICDLMMPEVDGFQLLQMVKSSPTLARIPIVIVTAGGQPAHVERVLRLGAAACLFKPFATAEFLATIERVLSTPK